MTILENFFFNPLRVNSKIQLTLSDISDDVSDDNWGIFYLDYNDAFKKSVSFAITNSSKNYKMTILDFFFNSLRVNSKTKLTLSDISDDVSDDDRGIFSCKSATVLLSPFISPLTESKKKKYL